MKARSPHPRPPRTQRGFSLLEAALLLVMVGAAIAAGAVLLKADVPAAQIESQEEALRWADQALIAYAAAHARLPCPVKTPSSAADDCVAPGEKGWLPVRALESLYPGGARPKAPIRYTVYRGGDGDLTANTDRYNPVDMDRQSLGFGAVNGLDLCSRLQKAARDTHAHADDALARTRDRNDTSLNIAYGLAVAGPTPGENGARFDGDNANGSAALESPARASSALYDDRVRVRDFASLGETLGCGFADASDPDSVVLASLDVLALATDINREVTAQHEVNKEATQDAVVMAGVSEAMAGLNLGIAGAQVADAIATLVAATATLNIPAIAASATAMGLSIGAAVSTGVGFGLTSWALALTIEARDLAAANPPSAHQDLSVQADMACINADGGYLRTGFRADGTYGPIDPPQWHDGLKQILAREEQTLATLETALARERKELDDLEKMDPSPFLLNPNDDDDRALLDLKMQAIRNLMPKRHAAEDALQKQRRLADELATLRLAVTSLEATVQQCRLAPPTDISGKIRCDQAPASLAAMRDCDVNAMSQAQITARQCVPWKEEDVATAAAEAAALRHEYLQAREQVMKMAEPDLQPGVMPLIHSIDADHFQSYANRLFYYQRFEREVATQRDRVADLRSGYATAKEKCEVLRALRNDPSGNTPYTVWSGADAILRAADCRGATGAVAPAQCGATP